MGPFPLGSYRKSVHELGVDMQIALVRHHFMDETQFDAYWGGGPHAWSSGRWQELRPDFWFGNFLCLALEILIVFPQEIRQLGPNHRRTILADMKVFNVMRLAV